MYKKLSNKEVTHMKKAFNEELNQLASKALPHNTPTTPQLHSALKELIIECKRKNIKITADELSQLALSDISTIKKHNENSHAVKYPNGKKEYFLHDKKLTKEKFNEWRAEQNSLNKKKELSLKIS